VVGELYGASPPEDMDAERGRSDAFNGAVVSIQSSFSIVTWMWVKMEDRCGTTDVNV
jgi:hypothetical protein